ncbi:MAG: metalloregulator ArsR/SmtB family transcription factor [Actinomycetota bacterium]
MGDCTAMRSSKIPESVIKRTASLFRVLGDPTRVKIITALCGEDLCVGDIAELVGVSDSAVSHQLRVLRNMGIVEYSKEGKNVIYSLRDEHIRRILEQSLDHATE